MSCRLAQLCVLGVLLKHASGPFSLNLSSLRRDQPAARIISYGSGMTKPPKRYSGERACTETYLGMEWRNSWSPAEKYEVYCPDRQQQYRVDRRCAQTTYCTDPLTKRPNFNLIPSQLTETRQFRVKTTDGVTYTKIEPVGVGCTCVMPVNA